MMGYGNGYGGGYDGGYGMMGGGFGGLLFLVFGVLIIAGIVLLVMWAIRMSGGGHGMGGMAHPPGAAGHHEAVAIAKRRFASGEINKEQYDEIMRSLGG